MLVLQTPLTPSEDDSKAYIIWFASQQAEHIRQKIVAVVKKIERIDCCYHVNRHMTKAKANKFLRLVTQMLEGTIPGPQPSGSPQAFNASGQQPYRQPPSQPRTQTLRSPSLQTLPTASPTVTLPDAPIAARAQAYVEACSIARPPGTAPPADTQAHTEQFSIASSGSSEAEDGDLPAATP